MTRQEMAQSLKLLESAIGKKFSEEFLDVAYQDLKDFPVANLDFACRELRKTEVRLPPLASILVFFAEAVKTESPYAFLADDELDFNTKADMAYRRFCAFATRPEKLAEWDKRSPREQWFIQEGGKLAGATFAKKPRINYGKHRWPLYHRRNLEKFHNFKQLVSCCQECSEKFGGRIKAADPVQPK